LAVATNPLAPHAAGFDPLPEPTRRLWSGFCDWDEPFFHSLLGLTVEELRTDYARIRLPWRPELRQRVGPMHGGALASLLDTVVIPAIGSGDDRPVPMTTISMDIQYLAAVRELDVVAEGWVVRRGRSIVFTRAEARFGQGDLAATASIVYRVSSDDGSR
jgi:uncharacterized protein (TIGR00369 family)